MQKQGTWASRTQKHSEAGYRRPVDRGVRTAKTVKPPRQQPAHPQYANYWAPLTRKRHTMSHSAQPQHTNYWAPRTRKRHQQDREKAATRHNMRREERVTVQGPVKEHKPDGMSHRGGGVQGQQQQPKAVRSGSNSPQSQWQPPPTAARGHPACQHEMSYSRSHRRTLCPHRYPPALCLPAHSTWLTGLRCHSDSTSFASRTEPGKPEQFVLPSGHLACGHCVWWPSLHGAVATGGCCCSW